MRTTDKFIHQRLGQVLAAALFIGWISGCQKDTVDPNPVVPAQKSFVEILSSDSSFSLLNAAITRANLGSAISAAGPFTVFAPSNAAFRAAGFDEAAIAAAVPAVLGGILSYHVLNGAVKSTDLTNVVNQSTPTLNGTAYVSKFDYGVGVNGVRVTLADVQATNGVMHIVDGVIVPPTQNLVEAVSANPNLSLLRAAVIRANLAGTLAGTGPLTVFAPTNAAFAAAGFDTEDKINAADPAVLAGLLSYHVLNGRVYTTNFVPASVKLPGAIAVPGKVVTLSADSVAVSGDLKFTGIKNSGAANVARANISATNGVIHVIDRVLLAK
ncbi:MAG: fasciclin domain-containing protein [Rudanella sp.]|nr:fasciclin domain-containing protein [Rudanella sp.]